MNSITDLARLFKNCENPPTYSPVFGKIKALPNIKIAVGDKILLDSKDVVSTVSLTQTDEDGHYVNLGKTVVMLPYENYQKYIVIGVVQ